MNPEFTEWIRDLEPSKWVMFSEAYAREEAVMAYEDGWNHASAIITRKVTKDSNFRTFQEWLEECFNRELGEKNDK